jgi:hypothetical protein
MQGLSNLVVVSLLFSLSFYLYPLPLFRESNLSFEGDSRWACHEDVVGGFIPFYIENSAIHLDIAFI